MGKEYEWKFRGDPEKIAAIREAYGSFNTISMETTYYDTMDLKLAFHHWTLRRRMENGVSVCTLKTPLEDGGRGEWEVECADIMPAVMQLCREGAPAELMRATAGGVYPTCGARFTRLAKTIELEDCTVELALDRGVLMGRGRELPFTEVEVELKAGSLAAAGSFAEFLARAYALEPERRSKFVRAMALAFGG